MKCFKSFFAAALLASIACSVLSLASCSTGDGGSSSSSSRAVYVGGFLVGADAYDSLSMSEDGTYEMSGDSGSDSGTWESAGAAAAFSGNYTFKSKKHNASFTVSISGAKVALSKKSDSTLGVAGGGAEKSSVSSSETFEGTYKGVMNGSYTDEYGNDESSSRYAKIAADAGEYTLDLYNDSNYSTSIRTETGTYVVSGAFVSFSEGYIAEKSGSGWKVTYAIPGDGEHGPEFWESTVSKE